MIGRSDGQSREIFQLSGEQILRSPAGAALKTEMRMNDPSFMCTLMAVFSHYSLVTYSSDKNKNNI